MTWYYLIMKILVFEGIATSGKSTLIQRLQQALPSLDIAVVDESKTHIPIKDQKDDRHIAFFKQRIAKSVSLHVDVIIFDRLYLTQAFRSKAAISDYVEIEELLAAYSPTTIFLKVDEAAIANRILKATKHRESHWGKYVKTKGQSFQEIASYYINQQRS